MLWLGSELRTGTDKKLITNLVIMEKITVIHIKNSWKRKLKWKGRLIRRKYIVDIGTKMGQLGKDYVLAVALPVSQQEWQDHQ